MKNTFLLLSITLFIVKANAQQIARPLDAPVSYIDSNFTKNNVKTIYNDSVYSLLRYDAYGKLLKSIAFLNDNIVRISELNYDIDGNLLKQSSDKNADSIPDNIRIMTYDGNGNQLTYSTSFDGGKTIKMQSSNVYNGYLMKTLHYDFNGIVNGISAYSYDENGNQIKSSYDAGADGIVTSVTTQEFDDNDNLLTLSHDIGPDGIPNRITTHTYDDKGNKLSNSYDTDADGVVDRIQFFTYDSNSNWVSRKDYNGIGDTLEYAIVNIYDEEGYLISKNIDHDGDGYFEDIRTFVFSYFKSCETIPGLSNKMYKVSIPHKGSWVFSTCSDITDFDTKIYIGSNPCSLDLGSNSNACTDNKSEIEIIFKKAQDIYVIVTSENNETGTYELKISEQ